ncbi:hypothetical protein [Legionella worsleiensis]|uniref:Uncharacterized protein n=1 Tax=Legionella worsleiensis TaxID=45076 RepID=A0A0W1AF58_9GAMM|nr:hypothetical protein [Legionella worsleiensis]KTD79961.1 hypothetical protein Lwor_1475 [Legionella worsleiensis]STY33317.1 SidC homolog [Legionella worsleiensis]
MAATEDRISKDIKPKLQLTLFGLIRDEASCQPGPEKTEEYNQAWIAAQALQLFEHVGHGRQNEAEVIIRKNIELLKYRPFSSFQDITGVSFSGTAFQYALWAMDTHMYTMMIDCLPQTEQGEEIRKDLLKQAEEQKEHFDFQPLIKALKIYVFCFNGWNWEQRKAHWSKVIGGVQQNLPAHVRHEYCHPTRSFYPVPSFTDKILTRSLNFYNLQNELLMKWDAGISGLGSDFAIGGRRLPSESGGLASPGGDRATAVNDLAGITALCAVRTTDLVLLKQRLQLPIQQPDKVQDVAGLTFS